MQLFKYFFRQFSCIIYVEVIFQVSIKSVERLRRKTPDKRTQPRNCIFYIQIHIIFWQFYFVLRKILGRKKLGWDFKVHKKEGQRLDPSSAPIFLCLPHHPRGEISKLSFQEMPFHANVTVQKCICVCIFVHTDICILFEKKRNFFCFNQ